MKYSDCVLDHFFNPRNVGSFEPQEKNIGSAIIGAKENGAVVHLQVKVKDRRIVNAKFKAYGNCLIIAACSFVTDWLHHKTIDEANNLDTDFLVEALNIPPLKIHCALLVEDAVKAALLASKISFPQPRVEGSCQGETF